MSNRHLVSSARRESISPAAFSSHGVRETRGDPSIGAVMLWAASARDPRRASSLDTSLRCSGRALFQGRRLLVAECELVESIATGTVWRRRDVASFNSRKTIRAWPSRRRMPVHLALSCHVGSLKASGAGHIRTRRITELHRD